MSGLTSAGFEAKTLAEIKDEIESDLRGSAALGTTIDLSPESVLGQLVAPFATKLREVWEQAAILYNARSPRNASFAQLEDVAAITGTARLPASKGRVTLALTLNAGVTVPAGSVAAVVGQPTNRWVTTLSVTNSGGVPATLYVAAEAETAGFFVANQGTITVIATPVGGWTAVTNPGVGLVSGDALPGTNKETDPQLRARRLQEISRVGTGTDPAIAADILELSSGVAKASTITSDELRKINGAILAVVVQSNRSSSTDAMGRPPKSVETLIQFKLSLDPTILALARVLAAFQLLFSTPSGIDWYGATTYTLTDSNGGSHDVKYTEPTAISVWIKVVLKKKAEGYSGADAVKAALVAHGDTLLLGRDVVHSQLYPVILRDVAGVTEIVSLTIGRDVAVQAAANLDIGPREVAAFASVRIQVVDT